MVAVEPAGRLAAAGTAERLHSAAQSCLALAVAASPLVVLRPSLEEFTTVKLALLWVLGIAAAALWACSVIARREAIPRMRLGLALAAFLGSCAVATVFSQSPELSLVGVHSRYSGLLPLALYALVVVVIVGLHWRDGQQLDWIPHHVTVGAALLSLYILMQASGHDWVRWTIRGTNTPPKFPSGTVGNSSFSGSFLGIAVPFVLYMALSAPTRRRKRALLAVLALVLVALWFTQSRSGMVAAAAGLAAMALAYRRVLPRWVTVATVSALALGAAVAVAVVWHPGMSRPPEALADTQLLRSKTLEHDRFWLWSAAWDIFREHPVAGTGLDTFHLNFPPRRVPADGALTGFTLNDKPHNVFLERAADSGVLGLGSFVALVGLALWYGFRRADRTSGPNRLLLVSFCAALVAYLAQAFFTIDAPPLPLLGWLAVAGIATLADPTVVRAREEPEPGRLHRSPRPAWWMYAFVGGVALILVTFGVRALLADVKADSGRFEQAIRLQPLEAVYRSLAGREAQLEAQRATAPPIKQRLLLEARRRYRQALRLQPGNVNYMADVARGESAWALFVDPSRFAEADRWWARVVRKDPTNWMAHHLRGFTLQWWADSSGDRSLGQRAVEQFDRVTRMGAQGPVGGLATVTRVALARAERLLGQPVPITSGYRSPELQAALYAERAKNRFLVLPPGTSLHERGLAVDVPEHFVPRLLSVSAQVGLCHPYPESDPIHFEVCGEQRAPAAGPAGPGPFKE